MSGRRKHRKSRKKLAYGIVAVAFILACFLAYFYLHSSSPPTASFVYSPQQPEEGQTVTFDASASTPDGGTIISYSWNFGDGKFGTGKIVTHAYTTAGTYPVTLNVTKSEGKWDIESKQITVKAPPPKAAIVDHLSSIPGQRNQTFVNECISILEEGGLTWAYYNGNEVTVDFYRNLPSYGNSLIILRVHSAIMKTEEGTVSILGLFTSERYYGPDDAYAKYPEDVEDNRLVRAFFTEGGEEYFGIVPRFIEKSMKGEFENAIVIMMGCEGIGYIDTHTGERIAYTDMAEAFVKRGAKVYISWDGPVGVNHTDQATVYLLERLILDERTIEEAVEQTNDYVGPDPAFYSVLKYHPDTPEIGDYIISNLGSSLTVNVAPTLSTPKAPKRSEYTAHRSAIFTL